MTTTIHTLTIETPSAMYQGPATFAFADWPKLVAKVRELATAHYAEIPDVLDLGKVSDDDLTQELRDLGWEVHVGEWDVDGVYTREQVNKAMNSAADDIVDELELPDTGARDALNFLVNVAGERLDHPDVTLEEVAEDSYDIDDEEREDRSALDVIAEWIGS